MGWKEDALRTVGGGIDGFLRGIDGGGTPPIAASVPVRTERVVLDRGDQAAFDNKKKGMSTTTIMMLGGTALFLVAILVMGRR